MCLRKTKPMDFLMTFWRQYLETCETYAHRDTHVIPSIDTCQKTQQQKKESDQHFNPWCLILGQSFQSSKRAAMMLSKKAGNWYFPQKFTNLFSLDKKKVFQSNLWVKLESTPWHEELLQALPFKVPDGNRDGVVVSYNMEGSYCYSICCKNGC